MVIIQDPIELPLNVISLFFCLVKSLRTLIVNNFQLFKRTKVLEVLLERNLFCYDLFGLSVKFLTVLVVKEL